MSEDTEKKPRIGGIGQQRQQYRTIGGQHQDIQTSERRDVQELEHQSSQEPEHRDVQELEHRSSQELEHRSSQELERPETLKRLNVQEPEHAGTEANKRERHTIYLPPELSEWLRVRAARKRQEMSEIATEAIQRYKDEMEK